MESSFFFHVFKKLELSFFFQILKNGIVIPFSRFLKNWNRHISAMNPKSNLSNSLCRPSFSNSGTLILLQRSGCDRKTHRVKVPKTILLTARSSISWLAPTSGSNAVTTASTSTFDARSDINNGAIKKYLLWCGVHASSRTNRAQRADVRFTSSSVSDWNKHCGLPLRSASLISYGLIMGQRLLARSFVS